LIDEKSKQETISESSKIDLLEGILNLFYDYDYELFYTLYEVVDSKEKTELIESLTIITLKRGEDYLTKYLGKKIYNLGIK
jgi:hypothetical protein